MDIRSAGWPSLTLNVTNRSSHQPHDPHMPSPPPSESWVCPKKRGREKEEKLVAYRSVDIFQNSEIGTSKKKLGCSRWHELGLLIFFLDMDLLLNCILAFCKIFSGTPHLTILVAPKYLPKMHIWPYLAILGIFGGVFERVRYGQVGRPWKDLAKYCSDALVLGQ